MNYTYQPHIKLWGFSVVFTVDIYPYGVYYINTLAGYNESGLIMIDKVAYMNKETIADNATDIDMTNENEICCCFKTTARTEEERKKLIHRLNRIEGQIRGIKGMVEKDAYCADILVQSAAVNAAVNAFNKELLAHHIKGCVARDIREGKDDVIDELVATLQKLMK